MLLNNTQLIPRILSVYRKVILRNSLDFRTFAGFISLVHELYKRRSQTKSGILADISRRLVYFLRYKK